MCLPQNGAQAGLDGDVPCLSSSIQLPILPIAADFTYSAFGGFWEQLAFAGMCLMMSFFFGLLSIHLLITGFSRLQN